MKVAGMIPSTVAAAYGSSRMPLNAAARLTSQNGKAGTSRIASR